VKSEGPGKTRIVIEESALSTQSLAARAPSALRASYPDPRRQSRGDRTHKRFAGRAVPRQHDIVPVVQVRISPTRPAGLVDPFSELFSYIEGRDSD